MTEPIGPVGPTASALAVARALPVGAEPAIAPPELARLHAGIERARELGVRLEALAGSGTGGAVLLADVERLATHVGILDRGRIVSEGTVEDWQRTMRRVQVVFPGGEVPPTVEVPGSFRSERLGPVLTAIARVTDDAQLDVLRGLSGVRVNVFPLTLEDLFVEWFEPRDPRGPMSGPGTPGPYGFWGRSGDLAEATPDQRVGNGVHSAIAPAGREDDAAGAGPAPYVEVATPRAD